MKAFTLSSTHTDEFSKVIILKFVQPENAEAEILVAFGKAMKGNAVHP